MKSLASLLARSKSIPLTDEQIRKHKELRNQRDDWRSDVESLRTITARLRSEYSRHKGDLALGRYEELKNMVKSSVEELNATVTHNKERRQQTTVASSSGAISSLKNRAESFAAMQERVRAEEKTYSEMSQAQLDVESDLLRREVIQLKQDFRSERDRLDRLEAAYADSKRLNPAQRYVALKDMIKDATEIGSGSSARSVPKSQSRTQSSTVRS